MITYPLPGGWLPAVAWYHGDLYWGVMVKDGPVAIYRLAGGVGAPVKVWEDPDATTHAFIRLSEWQGVLYAAYRIDRPLERIRQVEFDGARWSDFDRELTAGNNPVAIGDGETAQLQPGGAPFSVGRGALGAFALADVGTCPGTGLAYLTRTGFVTVDDNRTSVPGMLNPVRSGDLVVGEVDKDGPRCLINGVGGILWAGTGEWINASCAMSEDGRYAVTAWRADGSAAQVSVLTGDEVRSLPAAPVPEIPFGPLSDPLPEGAVVDIDTYVLGAPATWPRTGTHPMHQVIDGDRVHFVKFGDPHAYETWSIDADWIHHLEDASNPDTQVFTDTRWLPRLMRVGEAHAFSTGEHEAIWMRRPGCQEIRRGPYHRRMWVVAAWDRFSCGPDLGERPVVCVAYDPTGGAHAHDRLIELYFFAAGAGWIRWEAHRSDLVYGVIK